MFLDADGVAQLLGTSPAAREVRASRVKARDQPGASRPPSALPRPGLSLHRTVRRAARQPDDVGGRGAGGRS
jgi:hypothetical protein